MMLGSRIKTLRKKRGITQEELAVRSNLSVHTLRRIEKNEIEVPDNKILFILEIAIHGLIQLQILLCK